MSDHPVKDETRRVPLLEVAFLLLAAGLALVLFLPDLIGRRSQQPLDWSRGIDVSHVVVGQTYTFKSSRAPGATVVYEVKRIDSDTIEYTYSDFQDGNQVGQPSTVLLGIDARSPLTATLKAPEVQGRETITVSGLEFDCEVKEAYGGTSWASVKFPVQIRVKTSTGVVQELVEIADP